jgi:hypothetical protein
LVLLSFEVVLLLTVAALLSPKLRLFDFGLSSLLAADRRRAGLFSLVTEALFFLVRVGLFMIDLQLNIMLKIRNVARIICAVAHTSASVTSVGSKELSTIAEPVQG